MVASIGAGLEPKLSIIISGNYITKNCYFEFGRLPDNLL